MISIAPQKRVEVVKLAQAGKREKSIPVRHVQGFLVSQNPANGSILFTSISKKSISISYDAIKKTERRNGLQRIKVRMLTKERSSQRNIR